MEPKYIGLVLALCSSFLIGTSFIITKKALIRSSRMTGGKQIGNALSSFPSIILPPNPHLRIHHSVSIHPNVYFNGMRVSS